MTERDQTDVEHAVAALDKAMTDEFGVPYLIRKLEFVRGEHARANGITINRGRDEGLALRR